MMSRKIINSRTAYFGHLLSDSKPKTSGSLIYYSKFTEPGQTVFHFSTDEAKITEKEIEEENPLR